MMMCGLSAMSIRGLLVETALTLNCAPPICPLRAPAMPQITLYEHAPTRSARCRWTLLEAGLAYESVGNASEFIGSAGLRAVHPLGKLPVAIIDGRLLFESAAIATAIADLSPERGLIAKPGSWSRALHDQWVSFALTEMEPWLWSSEINSVDILMPTGTPGSRHHRAEQRTVPAQRGRAGCGARGVALPCGRPLHRHRHHRRLHRELGRQRSGYSEDSGQPAGLSGPAARAGALHVAPTWLAPPKALA